jgi:putative flavoprotein involved in K+ transport
VLERRDRLGGGWLDRWDSLCLVAPNFTILLPGKPYDGPDPDGFMPRDEVVNYLKEYAASFGAPVRLGSGVKRLTASNDHLEATTEDGATILASNVVLATGPYQRPKVPAASATLSAHIQQLHSQEYGRPQQLREGAVLGVGTGQSGAQIAEELPAAIALRSCAPVKASIGARPGGRWRRGSWKCRALARAAAYAGSASTRLTRSATTPSKRRTVNAVCTEALRSSTNSASMECPSAVRDLAG